MNKIGIYQTESGTIEVRLEQDTVWLSQAQIVTLFGRDQSVISRHIGNIFKEGELERESNMQKMHIANSDKPVEMYNLDVIISVGYRVKSQQGTRFRQWATHTLRELVAIEVKSGSVPNKVAGMDAFAKNFVDCCRLLIGDGGIPLAEFLSYPAEHWF